VETLVVGFLEREENFPKQNQFASFRLIISDDDLPLSLSSRHVSSQRDFVIKP
jgi:hypothetical protein